MNFGGIVGLATNASIADCHNRGNVWSALHASFSNPAAKPSGYYAGGIAGACIRRVIINGCHNEAQVKADSSYVGGLVGALFDSCQLYSSSNSSLSATVSGINQVGGLVGLMGQGASFRGNWIPIGTPDHPFRGTLDGQGHTLQFTINAPSSDYQGLFGYMQGTVENLYLYNCNVTGHDYVGTIAGYCHGTISNCGTKSSYSLNTKVVGNRYVGALVGRARFSEILDCHNGSKVSGSQYVGGIVGDFVAYRNDDSYGASGNNSWGRTQYDIYGGNVSRCFNFGSVKATNNDSYVGGIAGSTSTEVRHCYNSGIVDGKDKVGGICG